MERHHALPMERQARGSGRAGGLRSALKTLRHSVAESKRIQFWLALIIFSAATVIHMGGAITSCGDTVLGGPGDSTAGAIWRNWQYELLDVGPWPARSPMINAPYSERIWDTPIITAQALFTPMWLFAKATNHVCGWNIMIFLGLTIDGLAVWGLSRWLTGNWSVAIVAGYAYAYSPFHIVKSGHFAYIHSWPLVLALWAVISLWRKPSARASVYLGLSIGFMFYVDAYYILFGPVQTAAALAGALIVGPKAWAYLKPRLKAVAIAAAVAAVAILPATVVLASSSEETKAHLARNRGTQSTDTTMEEIAIYSARPHEYLTPHLYHPLVESEFKREVVLANMHGSNPSEQTLYLGVGVVVLALVGAWLAPKSSSPEVMVASGMLIAVALTAFVFSAPPKITLGETTLLMPSGLVALAAPFWRAVSRFFAVIHGALVALAAIGLHMLSQRFPAARRAGLVLAVLLVVVFEFITWPPRTEWSYRESPKEYFWLSDQASVDTVVEYPMTDPPFPPSFDYLTYQPLHEKKLFNYAIYGGRHQSLKEAVKAPGDPQTLPVLRALGVDAVLVHADWIPSVDLDSPPPGLKYARKFSKTGAYFVEEGDLAEVALGIESGFHPVEYRGWESLRWMGDRGRLRIWGLSGDHDVARLTFATSSFQVPRNLRVIQSGRQIHASTVGTETTTVEFQVEVGKPIDLRVSPGALLEPGGGRRMLSISFSGFRVSPEANPRLG